VKAPSMRTTMPTTAAADQAHEGSRLGAYLELSKLRLTMLVVVTAGVGYIVAAAGSISGAVLLATTLGTGLLSAAASTLNQWVEIDADTRMHRTATRPLPSGRLSGRAALTFAAVCLFGGTVLLLAGAGALTAGLGVLSFLLYVFVYTPLKTRTTLNTPVGAVVGALPPLMGWTAATGRIEAGGIALAGVLFVWQIPHFLAIAWMYRDDYARGGFKMLPVVDPQGRTTFGLILLYSLALIPVTLLAGVLAGAGWAYPVGAAFLGVVFAWLALRLNAERTRDSARRLFFASLIYLPLLLLLLVLDPTGSDSIGGVQP